jgi:hypothetical protein
MKIETKLTRFFKKIFKNRQPNGACLVVDKKTQILYLAAFDINGNVFIMGKSDSEKTMLEKIKQIFPGYQYNDLKPDEYDIINMFPGFDDQIHICLVNEKDCEYYASTGLIYETFN